MTLKSDRITVMAVYGTRPEAIKMAPLVLALREDPRFAVQVVVTGQHREMLDQVNSNFGIVPDRDLNIHAPGQTLTEITTKTLAGLSEIFAEGKPDAVLVQGDTSTTFVASLAAFYAGVAVVHTEAGLRTGDRTSPFPEEINRRLTGQIAELHLAPTHQSRDNLLAENVKPREIVVTGNSVIDALLLTVAANPQISDPLLADRFETDRPMVLITAHRRESWGQPLEQVGRAIARLAHAYPGFDFVFPAHRNPLVRQAIVPSVAGLSNVVVCEPLPYPEFCAALSRAAIVLTDSGGVQEEGPSLGKPVLVMRDTTERPEAVSAGAVRLIGTNEDAVFEAVAELIDVPASYEAMARALNPYGDGQAARRTVQALAHHYGLGEPADEFEYVTSDATAVS